MDENNNYEYQPQQPPQYPPQQPPQYTPPPQYPPQPPQQYGQPPQYQQPYPPQYAPPMAPVAQDPGRGMAIASMVLGIVSIPLAWAYVGVATAIVGLILGIIAKKKQKEAGFPTGMSLAGIICSIIGLIISIVMYALCIWALCAVGNVVNSAANEWSSAFSWIE